MAGKLRQPTTTALHRSVPGTNNYIKNGRESNNGRAYYHRSHYSNSLHCFISIVTTRYNHIQTLHILFCFKRAEVVDLYSDNSGIHRTTRREYFLFVFYAVSHDGYIRAKNHPEQQSEIQNRMIQHTPKQLVFTNHL